MENENQPDLNDLRQRLSSLNFKSMTASPAFWILLGVAGTIGIQLYMDHKRHNPRPRPIRNVTPVVDE